MGRLAESASLETRCSRYRNQLHAQPDQYDIERCGPVARYPAAVNASSRGRGLGSADRRFLACPTNSVTVCDCSNSGREHLHGANFLSSYECAAFGVLHQVDGARQCGRRVVAQQHQPGRRTARPGVRVSGRGSVRSVGWSTTPASGRRHRRESSAGGVAISVDPYTLVTSETIYLIGTHSRDAVLYVASAVVRRRCRGSAFSPPSPMRAGPMNAYVLRHLLGHFAASDGQPAR